MLKRAGAIARGDMASLKGKIVDVENSWWLAGSGEEGSGSVVKEVSGFPSFFFLYFVVLLSCGYIVTFTKYPSHIHPLHHSPLSPFLPFTEQFQQVSFFHFHIRVHNIPPYSPSYTLSLCPPLSHRYQPPDRTCFAFLTSVFENKKRNFCLR
jgi:hypothetical protein